MEEIRKLNISNTRIEEIDLLKSFGIILMIMGHIGFGSIFDTWIHSFHMPMFFIISGFLWKKRDITFQDFFKRKVRSLLVPYFCFSIFHLVIWIVLQIMKYRRIAFSTISTVLYHIFFINTEGMPICGALWFLTSLFFVEIFYFYIDKLVNQYQKYIIITILSIIGCIIPNYFRLPLAMDTSLMGLGLFEIGYALKGYLKNEKLRIINKYYTFFIIFIGSMIGFINGYVNVRNGEYANIILYYVCAVLMTIGLFFICKFWIKNKFIKKELRFIGMNSIVYVCLNQLILFVPNKISLMFKNFYIVLGFKIIIFILSMIILHFLVVFIEDNCRWILGK